MLWAVDALNDGSGNVALGDGVCGSSLQAVRNGGDNIGAYNKHLVTCSLFIDFILLDRDERRYMAQNPHQYLIEQVQYNGIVSTTTSELVRLESTGSLASTFVTSSTEMCIRRTSHTTLNGIAVRSWVAIR